MSSEDEDMESEYCLDTPEDAVFKEAFLNPPDLPLLSMKRYNTTYDLFQKWNKVNGATPVTEDVLMKYFSELAEKSQPSTLWGIYSMLKATLRLKDEIDISSYSKLIEYLKEKRAGYKPVTTKMFTEKEIEKFINEASDVHWLDVKVSIASDC